MAIKNDKQPLVSFTAQAQLAKGGIDIQEFINETQVKLDAYRVGLAGDLSRTDAWKKLQLATKSHKLLEGIQSLIISKMSPLEKQYNALNNQVLKRFSPDGGIDAIVLASALQVITSANMSLTEITASGDLDLMRAARALPAGRYLVTKNNEDSVNYLEKGIGKHVLGDKQYSEMVDHQGKLSIMSGFVSSLSDDIQRHKDAAIEVSGSMVEAA